MSISGLLAKGVGAAGIGLMAYDAHHAAKDYSNMYAIKNSTNNLETLYCDSLYLNDPSRVKDKAKQAVTNLHMDLNLDRTIYKIGGYFKSLGASISNKAIPLGLSAAALLTKGAISKASALGVITYTLVDFFGEYGHKQ